MYPVQILMGLPGSGKSHWVREFVDHFRKVEVCSADHAFIGPNGYKFDVELLSVAHRQSLIKWIKAVEVEEYVVCDNTNSSLLELAPYIASAQAFDRDVRVRFFETTVNESFRSNIHSVPMPTIRRMSANLQETTERWPAFWPKFERIRR